MVVDSARSGRNWWHAIRRRLDGLAARRRLAYAARRV